MIISSSPSLFFLPTSVGAAAACSQVVLLLEAGCTSNQPIQSLDHFVVSSRRSSAPFAELRAHGGFGGTFPETVHEFQLLRLEMACGKPGLAIQKRTGRLYCHYSQHALSHLYMHGYKVKLPSCSPMNRLPRCLDVTRGPDGSPCSLRPVGRREHGRTARVNSVSPVQHLQTRTCTFTFQRFRTRTTRTFQRTKKAPFKGSVQDQDRRAVSEESMPGTILTIRCPLVGISSITLRKIHMEHENHWFSRGR